MTNNQSDRTERDSTKYGEMIEDHEWGDGDDGGEKDSNPDVEAKISLRVYDERDEIDRYNGYEWWFVFDDESGLIEAVDQGHYCPDRGHIDPMGFTAWDDVPAEVRSAALNALRVDDAEVIVDKEATREVAEDQWP